MPPAGGSPPVRLRSEPKIGIWEFLTDVRFWAYIFIDTMLGTMKGIWKVALPIVVLAMVGMAQVDDVQAQQGIPPTTPWMYFSGTVTINGEVPTYSGFTITARIGDVFESQPVTVRATPVNPFRYEFLLVDPWPQEKFIGSQVEFWLNGEIKSTMTDWFAILQPCAESNSSCPTSDPWSIAFLREVDLDFPSLFDPEPSADVAPTPLPTSEPLPTTVSMPDIRKLRVGGFAIPSNMALIAMLAGSALALFGFFVFKRSKRANLS